MAFLHGVETIIVSIGGKKIQVVKSAVIALIGVAPKGPINQLTVVTSPEDAAQFGSMVSGFDIPKALSAILASGSCFCLVVNVFDPTTMTAQVTDEAVPAVLNSKTKLAFAPIGAVVLKSSDGLVTYGNGTDYSVDDFGNIKVLNTSAIAEGYLTKATYKKLDASTITSAAVIGTIDGTTGAKSGIKALANSYNLFGVKAKLILCPAYNTLAAVAAEMKAAAIKYRAMYFLDAPVGKTVAEVITGRGPSGTFGFYTSEKRAIPCYPRMKAYAPAIDDNELQPYSQFLAGLMSFVDNTEGYWVSPSNHEIAGIAGTERIIVSDISDPSAETNLLNEQGVVTVFSSFGTGNKAWGNRNASFPVEQGPTSFIAVQRTRDIIDESVEVAMFNYIDKPLNLAILDVIRDSVNAFFRTLVARGAIIDGKCTYTAADNPPEELAAGHATFRNNFLPPAPGERISFMSFVDINLFKIK